MRKEYTFNPKQYFVQITITSAFCAAIVCVSLYMIVFDIYRYIFCFVGLIAFYSVWNTFISKSNSSKVILEEDGITFGSYGRTVKYPFDEIHTFLAKDFRGSGKIFLRINDHNLFRNRFWIHTREFNDSDELYLFLLKLEHKTHPDSLKAKAWDSTRPEVDKTPVLPWNLPEKETGTNKEKQGEAL